MTLRLRSMNAAIDQENSSNPSMSLRLALSVFAVAAASGTAHGQTLTGATFSQGAEVLPNGSMLVIGQPFAGTMENESYTIKVGAIGILADGEAPPGCNSNATCDDGNPCTFDQCNFGVCSRAPASYADIAGAGGSCGPDGDVNLLDILAVLDGFAGRFADGCERINVDISGSQGSCDPNDQIDLGDILAVLDAFQGLDACCAGTASASRPDDATHGLRASTGPRALISLRQDRHRLLPGESAVVDVFVDSSADIRGYQLELSVATNVEIDTSREDYVFAETENVIAVDAARSRLAGARHAGGTRTKNAAYLGSFAIEAREDLERDGVFNAFLIDSSGRLLDSQVRLDPASVMRIRRP